MLKNSLFRKYFAVCSMCVIASITVLGVVLMAFSSRVFERDKYELLERNARQAAALTASNYVNNDYGLIEKSVISLAYSILSGSIDAEFFLTDLNGHTLYCELCDQGVDTRHYNKDVPAEISRRVMEGIYEETGTLGGIYDKPYYTVGVPVATDEADIGMLFVSASASGLRAFLNELTDMILLSGVAVLMIALIFIYLITSSLLKPLKEMLGAIQSFSQGDFSKRVPVSSYDEIGQLSMAFNNMASSLATTESSRRSFVANVSHELKTPMTTISGFVDGILDGTVPEEKHKQYLQVVSQEVKRLSRLVRSMLDTARIEAGEMTIAPTVFDISETIRQTVFTFEQGIDEKSLEIRGLDTDKVMVLADKDLMHQVVYNLIENAVKFVNENGYIAFAYRIEGKMTWVTIRNSGQGLEKTEVPQLFERFYKSDKSRSLNKNGVGLGLHIVRSIINYHKGEIVVRSVEGEYAEFEFGIPSAPKS